MLPRLGDNYQSPVYTVHAHFLLRTEKVDRDVTISDKIYHCLLNCYISEMWRFMQ